MDHFTVLIGNPGTGKSTILNGFFGNVAFASGVSIGSGKTQTLQLKKHPGGTIYGDTPGLSDVRIRKQAAQEITKILQENGVYKILFVITLEAGRARGDDVTTMRLVLDAIQLKGVSFGIIINKVKKPIIKLLKEGNKLAELVTLINNDLPHKTNFIYLMPQNADIDDEDNQIMNLPSDFLSFLENLPPNVIKSEQVVDVKHDEFEAIKEQMQTQIDELLRDRERLAKAIQDNRKQFQEDLRANKEYFERTLAKLEEEREEELQSAREREEELITRMEQMMCNSELSQRQFEEQVAQIKLQSKKAIAVSGKKRGYCPTCGDKMGGHTDCGGDVFYSYDEGEGEMFGVCTVCDTHSTGWFCNACKTVVTCTSD